MLDIFGNVFGRSKKQNNGSGNVSGAGAPYGSPSASRRESEGAEQDGFMVVGQTSADRSQVQGGLPNDGAPMYPTLLTDSMLRSPATASSTWNSHQEAPFSHRTAFNNPMDNVPFAVSAASALGATSFGHQSDVGKHFQTVERIGLFLSNPNLSDYNFTLEKSVVRESLIAT